LTLNDPPALREETSSGLLAKTGEMSVSLHPDTPQGRNLAAAPAADAATGAASSGTKIRSRLFAKYVALFVVVVGVALASNGIFEVFFYYREHKASLIRIQHEQAVAAAAKISQFIKEIESQLGLTTQLPWSAEPTEQRRLIEQRKFDALRLLRQVPAIAELAQVDSTGKERLRVSRVAMNVVDSGLDLSKDPKFTEPVAHKVYYGPVYFRGESEPYMTLALAGTYKDAGVSIAEVNLKLIWNVVSQIKVGEHGHAYVVGAQGRLIAHPDISLVLRNTDMSNLPQVRMAQANGGAIPEALEEAKNIQGQEVLTASAPIMPLRWTMFVELPVEEAYASLYAALQRLAIVLAAASIFAVLAGIFLARRMVGPIQALRAGAERIGGGDFTQRISIKTGDELEGLADQFNEMGARLQESYADLEKKVEVRTAELSESLEQQTATSEVLQVISSSPGELEPVFQKMLENATRACGANFGTLNLWDGESFKTAAVYNVPPAFAASRQNTLYRPHPESGLANLVRTHQVAHIHDVRTGAAYLAGNPAVVGMVDLAGARTVVIVPMLKEDELIGQITIYRTEVRPFTDKQIALVENFTKQAVIAIENTRLLKELRQRTDDLSESLEQQTATSEVLEVISSSPGELEPVFRKMLENATHVCGANFGVMNMWDGDSFTVAADYNLPPAFTDMPDRAQIRPHPDGGRATVVRTHQVVHIEDLRNNPAYLAGDLGAVRIADIAGARTMVIVPMLKEDELIGTITIFRKEVRPFTDKQIALVENFTKQAVIAIENTRLLKELRQRTDDLSESLEQQTATSEVLKVISSSPGELDPVFQTMLANATRICEANFGMMYRYDNGAFHPAALLNVPPALAKYVEDRGAFLPPPGTPLDRLFQRREVIYTADETAELNPGVPARLGGARSLVGVPMLKENELVGAIIIYRQEVRPFTDKQVELVRSFASQAVIAIENTRLLKELRQRTDDLSESLEQQTATSEVLEIISSSAGELEPVFQKMLENATRVCGAKFGVMGLFEGDTFRRVAVHNLPPTFADVQRVDAWRPNPEGGLGAVARTKQVAHIDDLRTSGPYVQGDQMTRILSDLAGARTLVVVPMLKEGELIGAISIFRQEVKPFTDKQIALVSNFANQAVIAIENARLLKELRQRTDDLSESLQFQTATSDVLKIISGSPDSLQPVLDGIVDTSQQLCGAEASTIFLLSEGKFQLAAASGTMPKYIEFLRDNPIAPDQAGSATARAARDKRTNHIPDISADPEFGQGPMAVGDRRALLSVPLMREGVAIGVITMRQSHLTPFTERQIEVVETFADQAVIAISNVRLFEEVQERTRELSQSLEDLRTAQDRLVQTEKLASLGQLTAGIAHEIKNPLNFINNFSALSAELIDEMNDVLKDTKLDGKTREEIDELTLMLKGNLEKVVQHGKRADSIVKNMLLHSREGSGEHRPADINAIVEESLNLAYHGARAEKSGFNIALKRDLDPKAGVVDLYPQEITRVFLNLISNGFYAATKRKEAGHDCFEPTLSAATKNLGNAVEIRIRDNGAGIPSEVKEKIFNPFFTTKPAGEGTGLGLSMSHDIVVKQHGGKIDVVTEPGSFTEFIITLPRTMAARPNAGGTN
jgi:GAF domain-containing protein